MLKVYFTASSQTALLSCQTILNSIKQSPVTIVGGVYFTDRATRKKDTERDTEAIFKRERKRIDEADAIVAEVTTPSTGVGGEIVYALTKKKPVLALVYKEQEDKLSPMLKGNPSEHLYLERYDFDNVRFITKHFLTHALQNKERKGRLFVIEGTDGSGKSTQGHLLINYFRAKKIPVRSFDFPRYYTSFHGKIISRFLRGEFGKIHTVSPYLISLAYALDRTSVKEEMDDFLRSGGCIVANRYATSNMAHQGGKFEKKAERKAFLTWVYDLEYKIHKIPKEDMVIFLDVPHEVSMQLAQKKEKRNNLTGKKVNIAEENITHQINTQKMYKELARTHSHWITIPCIKNGSLMTPHGIHEAIVKVIEKIYMLSKMKIYAS